MKKTLFLITIVILIVACTACVSFDAGDDPLTVTYHEDEIRANLQTIADDGGLFIGMRVAEEIINDEGESEIDPDHYYVLKYGANKDLFYYMDKEHEYVYDLRGDDSYVVYLRAVGSEEWNKQNISYTDTVNKESAQKELNEVTDDFFTHLFEHILFEGENMNRSSATVLERECDNYYVSMKMFGIGVSYNLYVDKTTGACLKSTCDTSIKKEDTTIVSFECTEINTSYVVAVPDISDKE